MKNEGPAQHRKHTPYGLTPFQMNVIHLVLGAGYPLTQGEIGFMNNAMSGGKVPPNLFKPRFDKICQQGFLSLVGVDEVWNNPKERRYMVTKRGRAAVADMGILNGGDYHYYRNFDGSASSLDKFLNKKVVIQGRDKEIDMSEILAIQAENAKKAKKSKRGMGGLQFE